MDDYAWSLTSTMRYRALPERRRSNASFIFDIGNVSVIGAMECRALPVSLDWDAWRATNGLMLP
jgi:hypothetical protein